MNYNKSFIPFICLMILISIGTSCKNTSGKTEEGTETAKSGEETAAGLEPAAFESDMKKSGAVILDLRFPADFEQGHIDGAININFFDGNFQTNILKLDRSKKYFLYSKGDAQTHRAGIFMKQNGFTDVSVMKGGWEAWKENEKK